MYKLTSDLRGVAVYLDDLLVSGANAEEHLQNFASLVSTHTGQRPTLQSGEVLFHPVISTVPVSYIVMGWHLKGT